MGTRTSVFIVRDPGSSAPAERVTLPSKVRPGYSRTLTFARAPARTPGATSCGTWMKTRTGSIAAILKSGVALPAVTSAPSSIERVVIVPAKGAVTRAKDFICRRRRTFASWRSRSPGTR